MSFSSYQHIKNRSAKRTILQNFIVFVAVLVINNQSFAYPFTCEELNGASLESQDYNAQYLGFFGNDNASDSVNNPDGQYGSWFGRYSVRNEDGRYGSYTGRYSANSRFADRPPFIVKYGEAIGVLTTNSSYSRGVSLAELDDDCYFTASVPAARYQLSVAKSGTGSGFVNSHPAGISCGNDCSQSYDTGTRIALYATPAPGSKFKGWSGACSGSGACYVTINSTSSVRATFEKLFVVAPIMLLLNDTN